MTVVWHRLGIDHPLVRELDRVSRAQNRILGKRQRLRHSTNSNSDALIELEAEGSELARQRTSLEAEMRLEIRKLARTPVKSAPVRSARLQLADVLAQRHREQIQQRDVSAG
jgi:hypothetical protein